MSVDLSDPRILVAYDDIVRTKTKEWLILSYEGTRDRLSLYASGIGGAEGLRNTLPSDWEDVFFGFCREEENSRGYYALIAYVPETVSGVRRARALVHSRAVGSLLKAHQTTLSINKLDLLNTENVRDKLHLRPSPLPRTNVKGISRRLIEEHGDSSSLSSLKPSGTLDSMKSRSPSPYTRSNMTPIDPNFKQAQQSLPSPPESDQDFRSQEPQTPLDSALLRAPKSSGQLKQPQPHRPEPLNLPEWDDDEAPPPTPAKDTNTSNFSKGSSAFNIPKSASEMEQWHPKDAKGAQASNISKSEFARTTRYLSPEEEEIALITKWTPTSPLISAAKGSNNMQRHASESDSYPAGAEPVQRRSSEASPNPYFDLAARKEERLRLRREALKRQEREEAEAERLEEERQARIKREREEARKRDEEEEARRRALINEQKYKAATLREKREMERRLDEERRARELEVKRQLDLDRRLNEARRAEALRLEEKKRLEAMAQIMERQRKAAEEKKRAKIQRIQDAFKIKGVTGPLLLTGSVTVQTNTSITWKRRYFELTTDALLLFRDAQDRTQALDAMKLGESRVQAVKEPSEGYEELEAIPNSFAVEFADDGGSWCMFTDTVEEKDNLISLLYQAAGL